MFLCQFCKSIMIIVDSRHSFTIINMNETPVPIGPIHSFHSYVNDKFVTRVYYDHNRSILVQ